MSNDTKQPLPSHVPGPGNKTAEPSVQGSGKMPMPQVGRRVAGMPRDGRVLTEPGEPGVPAEEDDVLDTSGMKPPGRID
ncbi:Uncharacterised protein [Bordetella ansorpii]|uniref:Uncharacterized protein n=1 Tax=Bordetella ansorpii TaxID=288768 RepID=A0A157QJN8_9BORD|nr:hypothetical protein [Bordetella ansorpii]SAI45941.1 Uncharacterised protein [Bordetella ansorpii]